MLASITAAEPIFKQWYSASLPSAIYTHRPFLAMVQKVPAGGEQYVQSVTYGDGTGRSGKFPNAQTNQGNSKKVKFKYDYAEDFYDAVVNNTAIELSNGSTGAVVKLLVAETTAAVETLSNNLEKMLVSSTGFNTAGIIASISGATITLTQRAAASNFLVGGLYNFAASATASTMRNSGAGLTVLSRDTDAGTVTFTANVSTLSAVAAADHVFADGDKTDGTPYMLQGLPALFPLVAPVAGDSFQGVDRSVDPARLAGNRLDRTGYSVTESVFDAAVRAYEAGGAPDAAFMDTATWASLAKETDTKVFVPETGSANIMFDTISVMGPAGKMKCVPSRNHPSDRIHVLEMKYLKLVQGQGKGEPIYSALMNGKLLDHATLNAVEIRFKSLCCLVSEKPWTACVVKIA